MECLSGSVEAKGSFAGVGEVGWRGGSGEENIVEEDRGVGRVG